MTLIKTALLNGIGVIVKMLALLGINKILAIYVGPSGYAMLGQFQNAVQMITTFASGAIGTGVTKYTAEFYQDESQQRKVWETAGTITLVGSLLVSLLVAYFNAPLAIFFLKDSSLGGVFIWFSVTLTFFVFNSLFLAVLNGRSEIKSYVLANIAGSVFSLFVTAIMVIKLGLYGALIALAIYQSLSFFVTIAICCKKDWFSIWCFLGSIDRNIAFNLAKYTLMALVAAICVPISQMLIRNYLGENFGWSVAGLWDGMWRLSSAYLLLATTTLGVYYLPKLSRLKEIREIKRELIQGYKVIIPATAFCAVFVYAFRDLIINLLFTKDFLPMRELFAWQMIGDTIKIASWLLAYLVLSKAMVKLYIFSEVFSSVGFVVLACFFSNFLGVKGVVVAYSINYFIYWVVLGFFIFRRGAIE